MAKSDETLYINRPGGVMVHFIGDELVNMPYGAILDPVLVAEHQLPFIGRFTDTTPRGVSEIPDEVRDIAEQQAKQKAAEGTLPGNYGSLTEEQAVVFIQKEKDIFRQAEIIRAEIERGARRAVIDAANPEAVEHAYAIMKQPNPYAATPEVAGTSEEATGNAGDTTSDTVEISNKLSRDVLDAEATKRGIDPADHSKKDDLAEAILEHDKSAAEKTTPAPAG